MHSLYNRVAGQSVERIAAFSDGIFIAPQILLGIVFQKIPDDWREINHVGTAALGCPVECS
ncbi:MAG: hypothetical protein WB919_20855, partial [Candidatus Sulfotelmatobacter sp.]